MVRRTVLTLQIVFNLSTLLQAASRSYRLNQEADECEVIYMFYQGTMEHTAVQLMSRKQRAAKILTGDTGLTGLDALTEGEAGFEAALLNAITGDDALIDPRDLFKQDVVEDEITAEDNAFWNVDVDEPSAVTPEIHLMDYLPEEDDEADVVLDSTATGVVDDDELDAILAVEAVPTTPTQTEPQTGLVSDDELADILASIPIEPSVSEPTDMLIQFAVDELGGVLVDEPIPPRLTPQIDRQRRYVMQYLETVSYASSDRLSRYTPRLLALIREGEWDDREDVKKVTGMLEDCYMDSEPMQKRLLSRVSSFLKQKKLISGEQVGDIAQRIIDLSLMAFDLKPLQLDIFDGMRLAQKTSHSQPILRKIPTSKPKQKGKTRAKKKKQLDLMALPDDSPDPTEQAHIPLDDDTASTPRQLAMFS